ncbi:hypothetical protein [Parablautia muri]|nr:hypothetical protein [Parablautia muri]
MALEGSLALPIFLFFMMTVLLSLEAVRFQCNMQEALFLSGNNSAFMGYQVKYAKEERAEVGGAIKEYLGNQIFPYLCVAGGEDGVILQDLSDINKSGFIEITAEYRLKPFIGWLPIEEITIKDRFFSHAWVGYTKAGMENGGKQEIYVYVTKTGERYHMSYDCAYLRVKIQSVDNKKVSSLRNASGGKYYACQRCKPKGSSMVYITAEGNSYHGQADCSSLKRTIYMIPISETKGYGACSKCAR